ncbi:MAG TPA: transglutaminaseTgpA domain-containing protein, partial [Anaerolineales bacterium]|nr:transglutaminaseTgpA domain-containing protein [Anaerolineales bacterium]
SIPYTLSSTADAKEFWQKTTGDWFNGDRFDNLFSSVNKEKKPQPRNFRTQMALGTQISQSELVVFLVYVPSNVDEIPRLYWRGQVFDKFENDNWLTTGQNEVRHNSTDGDLDVPDTANRRRFSFTYDVYSEGQTILYSASQPIWLNHNAIVLNSTLAEDDETLDVMALRPSPALEAGDLYRMSAMIADPTIPELQEAGTTYPDWVREKYLQLPLDFSPRIRALARQITAEYDTPYDKTQAVTDYLRTNIEYRSGISFPSADVDQIEYFLFERKQGFCNYYASAEVLMLRSLGIPARLAVGYAQGEPNLQGTIYTVREKDLHAWPEVYFPGYGWVEFEPTGNQDPLTRPLEREEVAPPPTPLANPIRELPQEETEAPTLPPETTVSRTVLTPGQTRGIAILGGGLLLVLVTFFLKRRLAPNTPLAGLLKSALDRGGVTSPSWLERWAIWASLTPIERHFHSINTGLRWMGRSQPAHSTAVERARILSKLIPDAAPSIDALLNEHQSAMFSPRGGDETTARRAAQMILYKTMSVRLKIFILGYN